MIGVTLEQWSSGQGRRDSVVETVTGMRAL